MFVCIHWKLCPRKQGIYLLYITLDPQVILTICHLIIWMFFLSQKKCIGTRQGQPKILSNVVFVLYLRLYRNVLPFVRPGPPATPLYMPPAIQQDWQKCLLQLSEFFTYSNIFFEASNFPREFWITKDTLHTHFLHLVLTAKKLTLPLLDVPERKRCWFHSMDGKPGSETRAVGQPFLYKTRVHVWLKNL